MRDDFHRPAPQPLTQQAQNVRPIAAAVDLYAFVRSLPADGRMLLEDVQILEDWMARYEGAPLPSRENLLEIVAKSLSASAMSADDRAWVYFAVDPALPRQLRRVVQRQRLLAEVREARVSGETCESVSFDFLLAGGHLFGYRERIHSRLAVGTIVRFARDEQPIDVNDRIRIELATGECVGFVPVDDAASIAQLLSTHSTHERAEGVVKKILSDGLFPIPVIGTRVPYMTPAADVPVAIEAWREPAEPVQAAESAHVAPPAPKSPLSALTRALGATLKPVTNLFR